MMYRIGKLIACMIIGIVMIPFIFVDRSYANVATRSKIDKIVFAGDIYFSRKVKEAYDEKGIDGIIDKNYKAIIADADFSVANLECAITDEVESDAKKDYKLSTPNKYIDGIKELGFNLFTLANNHILDFGVDGFYNTMKKLTSAGLDYFGAGKNEEEAAKIYYKTIDGKKYAFIAASSVLPKDNWKAKGENPGVNNGYDYAKICLQVKEAKKNAENVIVYIHWGIELREKATDEQKRFAHRLIDFGADLIVGAHPHVIQEVEYYKGVPIVYSLGNFVYGATKKETLLLEADFDFSENPDGNIRLHIYPGLSNYEQVKQYWKVTDFITKCKELQKKCSTCYVFDNGYIYSVEEVEAVLASMSEASRSEVKKLASSSEIK